MVLQREKFGRAFVSLNEGLLAQVNAGFSILKMHQTQCGIKPGILSDEPKRLSQ